jgi:hypothetical protein
MSIPSNHFCVICYAISQIHHVYLSKLLFTFLSIFHYFFKPPISLVSFFTSMHTIPPYY